MYLDCPMACETWSVVRANLVVPAIYLAHSWQCAAHTRQGSAHAWKSTSHAHQSSLVHIVLVKWIAASAHAWQGSLQVLVIQLGILLVLIAFLVQLIRVFIALNDFQFLEKKQPISQERGT